MDVILLHDFHLMVLETWARDTAAPQIGSWIDLGVLKSPLLPFKKRILHYPDQIKSDNAS